MSLESKSFKESFIGLITPRFNGIDPRIKMKRNTHSVAKRVSFSRRYLEDADEFSFSVWACQYGGRLSYSSQLVVSNFV
ncbi:MAG: hypothetical protein IPL04_12805 [Chitinophagaceae bacterium]|nr:hypothetical protein [Chitinophagaceae bacterium]